MWQETLRYNHTRLWGYIWNYRPTAFSRRVLGGAGADRAGDAEECGAEILSSSVHLRNSSQLTPK